MKAEKLLLEIGTEEMPARFLPGAQNAISGILKDILKENHIDYDKAQGSTSIYATPRRLAVILDVAVMKTGRESEVFGPPKKVAYNEEGTLTKAGEGFARSQGVKPEDLVVKRKGKGEYIAAVVKEEDRPTAEILPEILKKLVLSIPFDKSMRWGDGEIRFARPIHWIVALYGKEVVSFEIDGIKSGNKFLGHRFLSSDELEIGNAEQYADILKKNYVIASQSDRIRLIEEQAKKLAASVKGVPFYIQESHKRDVANLVEYPQAVLGSFDKKYLELPDELLSSVMWGHQKYFPVEDSKGNLKNYFIIVSNTKEENADTVRRGAERVIRARFDDARFYYEEDKARTLESRVEDLKKVTFHEKLGSLHDKTVRVKTLASSISKSVDSTIKKGVERAALLSKTDLTTGVVYEFPELQGIMGRYYAINDGEDSTVSEALREQYLPAFAGDVVPEGEVGAIVGLADRMDNIAAFFSIGLKPTGSVDPFALRRQALAIIAILTAKGYPLSIRKLLDAALEGLVDLRGPAGVDREILDFIALRLEGLLVSDGHPGDIVQSVMGFASDLPLGELKGRLDAIKAFKSHSGYNDFLMAIKRVRNIIPKEKLPSTDAKLMKSPEEKALLKALGGLKTVKKMVKEADYSGALERLLELTAPINNFFDKVLVMDKDKKIRNNRLALLGDIWNTASLVADFSKLSEAT